MGNLAQSKIASSPSFMTSAMWFVWLLRSDIRGGHAISDADAQRDFIAWWLLWAPTEYPAVFCWSREHAAIAMQLVELDNGVRYPRLLVRLHAARDDLQKAFCLDDPRGRADYLCWYRLRGPIELAAAPSLPSPCLAVTEEPDAPGIFGADEVGVPRIAIALSRMTGHPFRARNDGSEIRPSLAAWYLKTGHSLVPVPTRPARQRRSVRPAQPLLQDGVNLVGFVNVQSGLGEDLRMVAAGLSAMKFPHVVLDAACGRPGLRAAHGETMDISDQPVFDVSIYCMSAFDMAGLYLRRGPGFFVGQYRIGYWPWELGRFPDAWTDVYDLIDEIWTGSEFTARSYRINCPKSVHCLPAPVVVPDVERNPMPMIKRGAFVFTYPFDPNSYLARKNPVALVRAFHHAITQEDEKVALLLRVNGTIPEGPERSELLREISGDKRIIIMEASLDRVESLCVTASCNCLVSPHRAEGFGRNIAEAILLRVPVLATGFSGCEDFLAAGEIVGFTMQPVASGQYPFGEGLLWAEPIVAEMANNMILAQARMIHHRSEEEARLASRAADVQACYGVDVAGLAFVDRLAAINAFCSAASIPGRASRESWTGS